MARAMQSRCCWPPESPNPLWSSRSWHSSHSAADRRLRSTASSRTARRCFSAEPQPVGDVFVDRLWKWIRLLEDHADAPAQIGHVEIRVLDIAIRRRRMCPRVIRAPWMTSFMRLRQRSSVLFPQPDGPMNAVICRAGTSRLMFFRAGLLP